MAEKKKKADLLWFFSFYVNNLTLITWKVFHMYIFFKFVMHVTNKSFLDKFNNGWKKF